MKRVVPLLLAALIIAGGATWLAGAQTPPAALQPAPVAGVTSLNLTVTERQPVKQDLITANTRYEAKGKDAASLQDEINTKIKAALDEVKGDPDVKVSTEAYSVYMSQQTETHKDKNGQDVQTNVEQWQGSQSLTLEGADMNKLQAMTGKLQAMGFAVSNFGYSLSPDKAEQVRETLMAGAVEKLKKQADQAAKLLGKNGYEIKEVSVDNAQFPGPVPMMFKAARADMAASAMAAPNAEAGESDVSMTLSARVELK